MTIDVSILGGATRGRTRPRGFIADWRPHGETRAILMAVRGILRTYAAYLPLTIRQIFYVLVANYADDFKGFVKDERSYRNLGEILGKARRARGEWGVPMSALRDDGGVKEEAWGYDGPQHFLRATRDEWRRYRRDRQQGQERRLIVVCETAGMVPQLAKVADPYGITVRSSGGFDSLTEKHALAVEIAESGFPTDILHLGDYDPSGVHMPLALSEDVTAFLDDLGGECEFHRVAVMPAQIARLGLPTAPPKKADARAFGDTETVQCEAIAPDELARILREEIESRMDMAAYRELLVREEEERLELKARLGVL